MSKKYVRRMVRQKRFVNRPKTISGVLTPAQWAKRREIIMQQFSATLDYLRKN